MIDTRSNIEVRQDTILSERQIRWDRRFLRLAEFWASECSKDPSTKVGAVIVRPDQTIASMGFNGFARGVLDDERLDNRELKYPRIVHAEVNAIVNSAERLNGCTLYVYPLPPCLPCASICIQAGISRVVSIRQDNARWSFSITEACVDLDSAGIPYTLYPESIVNELPSI